MPLALKTLPDEPCLLLQLAVQHLVDKASVPDDLQLLAVFRGNQVGIHPVGTSKGLDVTYAQSNFSALVGKFVRGIAVLIVTRKGVSFPRVNVVEEILEVGL